jgi:DNA-binding MarR family transcriptional regulator
MSVQAITKALEAQGLTPPEKLLLIVLANYGGEASLGVVSSETGLDHETINRLTKRLADRGLLDFGEDD